MLSVVIPTYREAGSIAQTISTITSVLSPGDTIIVIDDEGGDGTAAVARSQEGVCTTSRITLEVLSRTQRLGLADAIAEGIARAPTDVVVVCDADGQHAYERIADLTAPLNLAAHIAVGARMHAGANQTSWIRRWIARCARGAATAEQRTCDPMSGFFALRKSALRLPSPAHPMGFKYLMEILSANPDAIVHDVPTVLRRRSAGASKLTPWVLFQSWLQARAIDRISIPEIVRYVLSGGLAFLAYAGSGTALSHLTNGSYLGSLLAYTIGMLVAMTMHSLFTYRLGGDPPAWWRRCLYLIGILLNGAVISGLVWSLHTTLPATWCYVLGASVNVLSSFVITRSTLGPWASRLPAPVIRTAATSP